MKNILRKITGLFALAVMLMTLALSAGNVSAQEGENSLSGGTFTDYGFRFSIGFPEGWSISHAETFDAPLYSFNHPDDPDHYLVILPKGEFDSSLPFSEPTESTILLDGRQALMKEWKLDNGEILIIITMKENYPNSWNEDNRIEIRAEEDMEAFDQMLESFEFLDEGAKNQNYITVEELGFKIPVDASMADDLSYEMTSDSSAGFRSNALYKMNEVCDYGSLGLIARIGGTPSDPEVEELIPDFYENVPTKQFEGFFLAFVTPHESCTGGVHGDPEQFELEKKAFEAVEKGFENLVLINE